jgi:hypothetical protein
MRELAFLLRPLARRLSISLVTFGFAAGLCAGIAQAAPHSLTGNSRAQIGNGLPIPITGQPVPGGRIFAIPGAIVHQTLGPDPKNMRQDPGQFRAGNLQNTVTPNININLGVFPSNSKVFQVRTQIAISGPGALVPPPPPSKASLKAGGRTGASAVQFCAGSTVPPAGNPGCLTAGAGGGINGSVRFTKTANQFGGPGQSNAGGNADVALRVGGTPPGVVTAIFAFATPAGTGAAGGPFGFSNMTAGGVPGMASGVGVFSATAAGNISGMTLVAGLGSGIANPATSYGVPWTTGMLTISVTLNVGPPSIFVMTGMDSRVSGVGAISLVSGSVSARALSGPNANRAWANYVVGPQILPTPAMSTHGLAAAFGLLALAGGYVLHRRARS